jgi:hypothetical protein
MTTIRAHGFDNPAQLREYLDELDDEMTARDAGDEATTDYDPSSALREIGWLRKEVADLRAELDFLDMQVRAAPAEDLDTPVWVWLASALAATFLVTGVTRSLMKH